MSNKPKEAGKSPEVKRLEKIVDYQEESVVSRTILKKEAGTVTVFAFGKGQGLSEHTAPYDAIVHILDGKAEITISGKTYSVNKGEMLILPAHEPHALKALENFKMLLIMIKSE